VLTSELIKSLYGVEVELQSLYEDRLRVLIPKSVLS
jgi:iron complex transport system ATP-binding protein